MGKWGILKMFVPIVDNCKIINWIKTLKMYTVNTLARATNITILFSLLTSIETSEDLSFLKINTVIIGLIT